MTYSSKRTPLGLLSRILEFEFGESRMQHYGIFEDSNCASLDAGTELLEGQRRFTKGLAELVETFDANAVVLIVGDTLLEFANSLVESGKSVYWFGSKSLLNSQADALANFYYAGDDFVLSTIPNRTDVLIYGGSIRYLDQMALLKKSRDLLGNSGLLILFSEFLHDDSRIEYSSLPNLSSFKQLSKRLGFEQVEDRDLTASASHTLELVRPLLVAHGAALASEAPMNTKLLEGLHAEFSLMQDEF